MKYQLIKLGVAAVLLMTFAGCSGNGNNEVQDIEPIIDVAREAGSFTTLIAAIEAAGLSETLNGPGPFTVFAPSDEAFDNLPDGTVENLLKPENLDKLANILTYHVISGNLEAGQVVASSELSTAFGQPLSVYTDNGVMVGNGFSMANVTVTDIVADNGTIHVIDEVLIPMDIVDLADNAGIFTTLLAAADAAGILPVLRGDGPLTIFAPTDQAFDALPEGTVASLLLPENADQLMDILTYHVAVGEYLSNDLAGTNSLAMFNGKSASIFIGGTSAKIDEANIITTDLIAANGLVHVIDAVILPAM